MERGETLKCIMYLCEPVPRESGKNSYLNLNKSSQYLASDQPGCYPYLENGLEVVRKQDPEQQAGGISTEKVSCMISLSRCILVHETSIFFRLHTGVVGKRTCSSWLATWPI